MFWRISRIPELAHLTGQERRTLLRQTVGWWPRVMLVTRSLAIGIALAISTLWLTMNPALGLSAFAFGVFVLTTFLGGALAYWVSVVRIRGQVLTYLERECRTERLPLCLRCGYDLRGVTSEQCPECGAAIGAGGRSR